MHFKEIVERYQARLFQRYGGRVTQHQRNALQSITDCRSERYGAMALETPAVIDFVHNASTMTHLPGWNGNSASCCP